MTSFFGLSALIRPVVAASQEEIGATFNELNEMLALFYEFRIISLHLRSFICGFRSLCAGKVRWCDVSINPGL
jgi:hypothetical protein